MPDFHLFEKTSRVSESLGYGLHTVDCQRTSRRSVSPWLTRHLRHQSFDKTSRVSEGLGNAFGAPLDTRGSRLH